MKKLAALLIVLFGVGATALVPAPPEAEISNGIIRSKLYLPDADNGYYRGSRFDWAGVISSLDWNGHQYFGAWFKEYSPTLHDAIQGPVEAFDPIGYTEAKPGETFVKIGIGVLTKPDASEINFAKYYPIVNNGKWKVTKAADHILFQHTLQDKVCSYEYNKTVALTKNKPQMVISHTLKNTGSGAFETFVYNHNFFVMDAQPTGTGFSVTFPFEFSGEISEEMNNLVEFKGPQMIYRKDLKEKEHVFFRDMTAGKNVDYSLKIENHKTGAAVKITGDQPIAKLVYWCAYTTLCPEPYVKIRVEPGKEFSWKITYDYYECEKN